MVNNIGGNNRYISIHALLAESDDNSRIRDAVNLTFLSTLSLRRATVHYDNYNLHCVISIHALLAESDATNRRPIFFGRRFLSTLSLRRATTSIAGRITSNGTFLSTLSLRRATNCMTHMQKFCVSFLSTLSLRRATLAGPSGPAFLYNFYPRSPCGERPIIQKITILTIAISIHALLAESDVEKSADTGDKVKFLSTLSLRRATRAENHASSQQEFLSTLSLRRATFTSAGRLEVIHYFYPRSPCGERQTMPSVRHISKTHFYPRSPCGERPSRRRVSGRAL